jgi:hypothetical protein
MNEELLVLQAKVNGVIYNPFVNLKDLAGNIKNIISGSEKYGAEVIKLEAAMKALDEIETLNHGNIDRIKGFNKTKNTILKIIKELLSS